MIKTGPNFSFLFALLFFSSYYVSFIRFVHFYSVCSFSFPFVEVSSANFGFDHLEYSHHLTTAGSIEDQLMCDNHSTNLLKPRDNKGHLEDSDRAHPSDLRSRFLLPWIRNFMRNIPWRS